jgi:hypothetical protein
MWRERAGEDAHPPSRLRRQKNGGYNASYREIDPPIDPDAITRKLRAALDEAERFVAGMPSEKAAGCCSCALVAPCSPRRRVGGGVICGGVTVGQL